MQLLSCSEVRIVLERQISGPCFSLYTPLHALVVDIYDKKVLLVISAFSWALLLTWVLMAGSWRDAFPCRKENATSSFSRRSASMCWCLNYCSDRHTQKTEFGSRDWGRFSLQRSLFTQDRDGKLTSTTSMVILSQLLQHGHAILRWSISSLLSNVSISLKWCCWVEWIRNKMDT